MRRASPVKRGSYNLSRKKCVMCKLHIDTVGSLSRAGICGECATVNNVAHMMGMAHMFFSTEDVNGAVLSRYTGPVSKVA